MQLCKALVGAAALNPPSTQHPRRARLERNDPGPRPCDTRKSPSDAKAPPCPLRHHPRGRHALASQTGRPLPLSLPLPLPVPLSRRALLALPLLASPLLVGSPPAEAAPAGPTVGPLSLGAPVAEDEDVASRVFEESTPSVAAVMLYRRAPREEDDILEGTGSGIVWDKYGHIVTNYHVISRVLDDNSGQLKCLVGLLREGGDMLQADASVIGTDASRDLAVLKVLGVAPEELSPAAIGTSGGLRVGQSCFAVGNPRGFLHTLTAGVVSGLGRAIPAPNGQAIPGAIQTDASINSGNSGGPLLDSSGRVIGINTATFTRSGTGTSSGVNFALPVDTVSRIVPQLIVYGTLTRSANAFKR